MEFGVIFYRFSALLMIILLSFSAVQAVNRKARKCLLPAQSGRCFGYVPSYAYNPIERKCEIFIYGGCSGNENRFDTKTDCEKACRDI